MGAWGAEAWGSSAWGASAAPTYNDAPGFVDLGIVNGSDFTEPNPAPGFVDLPLLNGSDQPWRNAADSFADLAVTNGSEYVPPLPFAVSAQIVPGRADFPIITAQEHCFGHRQEYPKLTPGDVFPLTFRLAVVPPVQAGATLTITEATMQLLVLLNGALAGTFPAFRYDQEPAAEVSATFVLDTRSRGRGDFRAICTIKATGSDGIDRVESREARFSL